VPSSSIVAVPVYGIDGLASDVLASWAEQAPATHSMRKTRKLLPMVFFHNQNSHGTTQCRTAVTRDDEEILLRENESVFVPLGCMHRLENPGKVPLNLIEIQSGAYLGEDDIVRMQDIYHRV
jgi:hypothetical protein